ncbi:MAG: Na+/H+ antiporter subunit E [Myxococcales bacterium]|jgi:multicomponent Na+:H+ antiporter subunit E|nr:Na+/H+ antiporter subunit E [Myxococcales bacterium]
MLLGNLLLAIAWAALQGEFSLKNLLIGYGLGYLIIAGLTRGGVLPPGYRNKVHAVLSLAAFLFWAFMIANLRMAIDVMRPVRHMKPGIVQIPLDAETDYELLLLSTLINLTPGTISLDISKDNKILYLHVMHVADADAVRREIKHNFERRVLEVLR